jgi:acetyltransferase-like isoleucine patch superfamily enzyme
VGIFRYCEEEEEVAKAGNCRVYEGVQIGSNVHIGDYAVLGVPFGGGRLGELKTIIGHRAVIRSHTMIYAGVVIGDRFTAEHAVTIHAHAQIGEGVSIGAQSIVGSHVIIGDGVLIESGVFIADRSTLQEGCRIGPNVVLANPQHPDPSADREGLPATTVGSKARIAASASILPGITLGSGALVAAGALVVEDVPDGVLVRGSPARLIDDTSRLSPSEIVYLMGRE